MMFRAGPFFRCETKPKTQCTNTFETNAKTKLQGETKKNAKDHIRYWDVILVRDFFAAEQAMRLWHLSILSMTRWSLSWSSTMSHTKMFSIYIGRSQVLLMNSEKKKRKQRFCLSLLFHESWSCLPEAFYSNPNCLKIATDIDFVMKIIRCLTVSSLFVTRWLAEIQNSFEWDLVKQIIM